MSVDSKIVDLKFNYSSFMDGVKNVLSGIASLQKNLQFNAGSGFDKINAAAKGVNMTPVTNGVAEVTKSFSVMEIAGVAALATLVSQAVSAGTQFAKGFTVSPIIDGFTEYETKMKSIQTILANTARHGTGLETVNHELEVLNQYADKTIYNFSEMTKNASLFTNSGMKIEDATQVIKGFSNAAAASGTGATEAAGAAYQLSQAFATGTIRLMDWRSLTNRGMGNKNMQDSLITLAEGMGTFNSSTTTAEKVQKDFNGSLETGWLTADVMSTYLQAMTGDMTDAQLASKGLSEESVKNLQAQAKTALEAATKVRTFTQLMGTMKEAVASGWTSTFEILFGDFEEATNLFTGVSDTVGGALNKMSESRNKLLTEWKERGGRLDLIEGFKNGFTALFKILGSIKDGFREIFPPATAKGLAALTSEFRQFTSGLIMGDENLAKIKATAAGFFAIFSIAGQIIGGAIGLFKRLFSALSDAGAGGGFLDLTSGIGNFLVSLDKMLEKGDLVKSFFNGLGDILAVPLKALSAVGKLVSDLFVGFDMNVGEKFGGAMDTVGERILDPVQRVGEKLRGMFEVIVRLMKEAGSKVGEAMRGIGDAIAKSFTGDSFDQVLDVVNTGLLAALVLMFKKFFSNGVQIDVGGGLFDSIKETLGSVTEAAQNMQANVKADTLLKIAGAIAILAASLLVLSTIDSDKLRNALVGATIGFIGMQAALISLTAAVGFVGALKLPLITASLMGLAASLLIMAGAMKVMASINGEDMVRGLAGLGGSMVILAGGLRLMPKNIAMQAAGLVVLALALNGIALALRNFAGMDFETMARGLVGVGGSLAVMALGMRLMPNNMIAKAAALTILAVALNGIGLALRLYSSMSMEEIGRGMLTLAGSLLIIAAAMTAMPPSMILLGPALAAVGVALNIIAGALVIMGGQSIGEMAVGLGTLAASLAILAAGLTAMSGALPGAAALVVAAGALAIFTPVLITLGSLNFGTIVKGLLAIAGIFTVLGVAGALLGPLVPVILGLAAAMVLIGAGMALAGAGVLAFTSAFAIAVTLGAAGVKVLGDILGTFIKSIPAAMAAFGQGVVAFAKVIGKAGAAFFKAFSTILSSIIKAINANIPKIGALFLTLVRTALRILVTAIPQMVSAGMRIILGVLQGINANIGRITTVALSIITRFLRAVAQGLPSVIQAGVRLVISFVNGVANAIRNNSEAMGRAGANLGLAIVEGMARGIAGGLSVVTGAARRLASSALSAAKGVLGIRSPSREFEKIGKYTVAGFVKGLDGSRDQIQAAYNTMGGMIKEGMKAADDAIKKHTERLSALRSGNAKMLRDAQDNLTRLQKAEKRDAAAIAKAQRRLADLRGKGTKEIQKETAALLQARMERRALGAAYKDHTTSIGKQTNQLKALAIQQDSVNEKLKESKKTLEDATKTRDDYAASIKNQLADLPEVTKETKLEKYIEDLSARVAQTQEYARAIQELRKRGLNNALYKELLAKGPEALPFITQALSGGQGAVDAINKLGTELDSVAAKLGTDAASSLYQAGVDVAQGLVKGLESQKAALETQMDKIASSMVNAFKRRLGIKSPSKEFEEIGVWSIEGLALGLQNTTSISKAANVLGDKAIDSLRTAMSGLGSAVSENMDLNPTITPVLDLTALRKDAQAMGSILPAAQLRVDGAYSSAKSALKGYNENMAVFGEVGSESEVVQNVSFVQNNHSPKALSEATIYRNTRNQLSRARGTLT